MFCSELVDVVCGMCSKDSPLTRVWLTCAMPYILLHKAEAVEVRHDTGLAHQCHDLRPPARAKAIDVRTNKATTKSFAFANKQLLSS